MAQFGTPSAARAAVINHRAAHCEHVSAVLSAPDTCVATLSQKLTSWWHPCEVKETELPDKRTTLYIYSLVYSLYRPLLGLIGRMPRNGLHMPFIGACPNSMPQWVSINMPLLLEHKCQCEDWELWNYVKIAVCPIQSPWVYFEAPWRDKHDESRIIELCSIRNEIFDRNWRGRRYPTIGVTSTKCCVS